MDNTSSIWAGVRLFILTRYVWLFGALLVALGPLSLWGFPSLLYNVFVLDTPWQLYNVTWLSLLAAALLVIVFQVIRLNAPLRFQDYRNTLGSDQAPAAPASRRPWRWRWFFFVLLGLPVPVCCVYCTLADERLREAWLYGIALVGGVGTALLVLVLLAALQQLILPPEVKPPGLFPVEEWGPLGHLHRLPFTLLDPVGRGLARVLNVLGPGFADQKGDPPRWQLTAGNAQLLFYLIVLTAAYFLGYFFMAGGRAPQPGRAWVFPAIFFVLLLLLLLALVFNVLAFLLDYVRVPVLLAVGAFSFVLFWLNHTDHYYELNPDPKPAGTARPLLLTELFDQKTFPSVRKNKDGKPQRILVVVTAAGGGIQASAWSARVLTGLHEQYGPPFAASVGLVSAVSGGSVAVMHYLNAWNDDREDPLSDADLQQINAAARVSCLEATSWGMVYPELLRVLVPPLVKKPVDRGWAIEEIWRRQLKGDPRLLDWVEPIRQGRRPAVVFNAASVETGQRFLISPVATDKPASASEDYGAQEEEASTALEFARLFAPADHNLRLSTAVRMSATFAYVSPICRPLRKTTGLEDRYRDYHVADGGYIDNDGVLTAVDWLEELLSKGPAAGTKFDRVILVRIQAFPADERQTADDRAGWAYELYGPVKALEEMRVASQAERNDLLLRLLARASEHPGTSGKEAADPERAERTDELEKAVRDAPVHTRRYRQAIHNLRNHKKLLDSLHGGGVPVHVVRIVYNPHSKGPTEVVPLSWKLSRQEQHRIDAAWQRLLKDEGGNRHESLLMLDHYFDRRSP